MPLPSLSPTELPSFAHHPRVPNTSGSKTPAPNTPLLGETHPQIQTTQCRLLSALLSPHSCALATFFLSSPHAPYLAGFPHLPHPSTFLPQPLEMCKSISVCMGMPGKIASHLPPILPARSRLLSLGCAMRGSHELHEHCSECQQQLEHPKGLVPIHKKCCKGIAPLPSSPRNALSLLQKYSLAIPELWGLIHLLVSENRNERRNI